MTKKLPSQAYALRLGIEPSNYIKYSYTIQGFIEADTAYFHKQVVEKKITNRLTNDEKTFAKVK